MGLIVHCTDSGNYLRRRIVKKSDNASSYRGKVLGGILTHLVLKAATRGTTCRNYVVKAHRDNTGVLYHLVATV